MTSATYYPSNASNPPNDSVTLGTGDSDVYTFDANTGRLNGFVFTVGSTPKTLMGTPGWNANGTLGSLGIVDQFNPSNTQNCTYVYDDLARVNSVNCTQQSTTIWNQSFTLDPFGNISKSGSSSFAATYVANGATNNQEQMVSNCAPAYDANGNLTKDCTFITPATYAWDADGNAISLNGVGITSDALDREVEISSGSTYTQVLYSPIGKLGLMNGQNTNTVRIPLPGGSAAEMLAGGNTHILHSDWLGSSRLSSGYSSRAMVYDAAYAPYGETYVPSGSATEDQDFTGQFQDSLSGLYDFLYRENSPVQGRWISPDRAGLGAVDPSNPQSWNRYTYVTNNPLSLVDSTGLHPPVNPTYLCDGVSCGWYYMVPCEHGKSTCSVGYAGGIGPSDLDIVIAAFSGSYETVDPSKPWVVIGDNNGTLVIGGCDGCINQELPQMMTVFPNISLLGLLSNGYSNSDLAANNGTQPPGVPKPPNPILQYDKCVTQNVNPAKNNAQKVSIINGVTNLNGLGLCAFTGPDAPLCVGVLGGVATVNSLVFWAGGQITVYDAETQCLQQN